MCYLDIKLCFPQIESFQLTNNVYTKEESKQHYTVMMNLILKFNDAQSSFSFQVVLFKNSNPDFLIYSDTYEKNKPMYQDIMEERYFENVIEDVHYKIEKIKVN